MMPLFIILLGIIQFGFIFNAYVTITNATREGARLGTVYVYEPGLLQVPERPRPEQRDQGPGPRVDEPPDQDGAQLHDLDDLDPERDDLHERRPHRDVLEPGAACPRPTRASASRSGSGRSTTRT